MSRTRKGNTRNAKTRKKWSRYFLWKYENEKRGTEMIEPTYGELTVILPTKNVNKFIALFLESPDFFESLEYEKEAHFANAYLTRHEERGLEQEGMSAVWVEFEYGDDITPLLDIEEARRKNPNLCKNAITLYEAIDLLGIKGFSLTGHEDGHNDSYQSSLRLRFPPKKFFEQAHGDRDFEIEHGWKIIKGEGKSPGFWQCKIYEIWCVDTYLEHEWCEEVTTDEEEAYKDTAESQKVIGAKHERYQYELREIRIETYANNRDELNDKRLKLSKLIDESDLGLFYNLGTREPRDLEMIMEADDSDLLDSEEIKIKKLCLGLKKAGIEPSSCECYDIKSASKIIDEREEAEHMGETQEMRDEEKGWLLLDDPFRFEMD